MVRRCTPAKGVWSGLLTEAEATALVAVHPPVEPDPEDAALYRRLRPLVEQSTLALSDVFAALDTLSPALAGATEEVP